MQTILIIEDNLEVRENTAEILELANYNVLTAENGKLGVELAKKTIPDLIICDIMMPELDGYGVLHLINKLPETAAIPFIFLTAKTERSDVRKNMSLGADDYLTKPFDDVELLDAVEIRLRKKELYSQPSSNTIDQVESISSQAKGLSELEKTTHDKKKISLYKKKQLLYNEGNTPSNLFFVVSGKVKVFKTSEDGRSYIIKLYKEGDFIGYTNLMEDSAYIDSAMTLEDSNICMIPKQEFFNILYSDNQVAQKFIKMLSNDISEQEERLLKLAYNSVRKRVAESLLLIRKNYSGEDLNTAVTIPVSREDLASIVGASKETVIRTLSDFKDEGLIDIAGHQITLTNGHKLAQMKN
jgi:CRP/FNR family transcriptional regulator, polysaccharide utilization system transcription regulator